MPIYEYACDTCGATLEVLQRVGDAPPAVHDQCGGSLRRLFSVPQMQVKADDGMRGSLLAGITTGFYFGAALGELLPRTGLRGGGADRGKLSWNIRRRGDR